MAYTQNVSAGMVVTGEVVDSGIQTIGSGGIASHAVISGGSISIEKGGVLYMTDWDFDTALDWQGLPRLQDGKVDGATVKSGDTLWIGGSSAHVRNVTVEKGGYVTGFHVLATIRNLEVYNGSGYDTITYSNAVIKNFDLSGMNDGQGTILYDRGWVVNATSTPTNANIFGGIQTNGASASSGGNINFTMFGNYQRLI